MRKKYVEEVTINKPYGAVIVDGVEELMRDEDFKSIAVYKLPGRDISFIACPDHESGIRFLEGIFKFIDINIMNTDVHRILLSNLNTEYRVCCMNKCVSFGITQEDVPVYKDGKKIKCMRIINSGVKNYEEATISFDEKDIEEILDIIK